MQKEQRPRIKQAASAYGLFSGQAQMLSPNPGIAQPAGTNLLKAEPLHDPAKRSEYFFSLTGSD